MNKTLRSIVLILLAVWAVFGIFYTISKIKLLKQQMVLVKLEQIEKTPTVIDVEQIVNEVPIVAPKTSVSSKPSYLPSRPLTLEELREMHVGGQVSLGTKSTTARCIEYQSQYRVPKNSMVNGICYGTLYAQDYVNWLNENY